MPLRLETDREADAGYVTIRDAPVARSDRFSAQVLVDADAGGALVGIELLTLTAEVDVDGIADRYALSAAVADEIRDALTAAR